MRDYLQRLYNVGVVRIRSYIEQQPITRVTRDGRTLGQWRRPKSEKRMTVELRDEFVWPQEPEDLKKYVVLLFVVGCARIYCDSGAWEYCYFPTALAIYPVQCAYSQVQFANHCFNRTDGKKKPGTQQTRLNKRHRRPVLRRVMHPRSRIRSCARRSRSRRRSWRVISNPGSQPGRH